jgi:hypothetical protein
LNVYNLSEMSQESAEALIAETEGRLCVRFYQRADGTVLTRDCADLPRSERPRSRRWPFPYLRSGVAAASLLAAGCGIGVTQGAICPPIDRDEVSHINRVHALAVEYQNAKKAAPASLDQLESWAAGRGKAAKDDFISPRDGKPYLLGPGPVVAEREGKGARYLASPQGTGPRSDDEINKLFPPGTARAVRRGSDDSVQELTHAQIKRLLAERAKNAPAPK